jgi:uncharacterized membrane protein YhaH (DUF805 family)
MCSSLPTTETSANPSLAEEGELGAGFKDAIQSVIATIRGTFTFNGRARIVDVIYFWLASMVVGALIALPLVLLPWDLSWFADRAANVTLCLPVFALFARRLQDQGISGWWTLVALPLPAINLYQSYRAVFAVRNPGWLDETNPLEGWSPWLFAVVLAMLVLFLRPGTRGTNRYGPDPREVMTG